MPKMEFKDTFYEYFLDYLRGFYLLIMNNKKG